MLRLYGSFLRTCADSKQVANLLFKTLCTALPQGQMAIDPRGLNFSQLKRYLRQVKYEGELSALESKHSEILAEWQRLYDEMLNKGISLPGREKAGPLTFHKVNDDENVRDLYDQNGRTLH